MSGPTRIVDQIDTINTVLELFAKTLTAHEYDCLRATLALLQDGRSNRITELEQALAWALPVALYWRGSLMPDAWPEFDAEAAPAKAALAKSTQ